MFCIWKKRWLAWVLIFFFWILALHYKTPYPRHVSIKKNSAALYHILSIKVFVYSRLIMPSAIKSYLSFVVFTAGQYSPKCVGAINLKTQESSKEEDQRIHSFVLEILWGCYKIKTRTLFSLWHFLVHLEILCIIVHITRSLDIFVQCDIILEETFAFSGITFSTGSIYLYE